LVSFFNITERIQAAEALERQRAELTRSNAELAQFAFVTSHDLQEPLRMITSYVQLLARRYKGQLDENADDFINFAVEGTTRMQRLINDLLEYSRVGTRGSVFTPTACENILKQVMANLQLLIQENNAVISHDPLPILNVDELQVGQLFQNLIANALKFHSAEPTRIHISAKPRPGEWVFSIQDNGIGIDPQYFDQIFVIFQRLHTSAEYSGTGIGLAICKKIVERHGGKIWVQSESLKGSTFYFTLPA
jgi:light-regulated signal transduction histidine kinase (bacteriophytochrome)